MPLTRDAHIARWGELVNDECEWRYDTVQIILKALGRSETVIAQMQPPWRSLRDKSNRRVFLESLSTQEIVSVHLKKLKKALDAEARMHADAMRRAEEKRAESHRIENIMLGRQEQLKREVTTLRIQFHQQSGVRLTQDEVHDILGGVFVLRHLDDDQRTRSRRRSARRSATGRGARRQTAST